MAVLQMTWQPSLLNHKRKSGPPLGLKNLGNSCYLNSVLQCLTYTPPLANFCLKFLHSSSCDVADATAEKKRECPFCLLEKRIVRSLSTESTLDAPAKINSCLRIFSEHFIRGRQEDAHEFLRYVIDACHNTCLRLKKLQLQRRKGGNVSGNGNDDTIVKDIFGGALQSQVKCLSCGSESNKVDEIMDLSLDILHSGSLKDALQRFFQPESLDGNNKYKCDNCKKLVAARKQMSILQAPNVLVIQLKRFEGIFGGKIDKAVAFEEVLVLSSYMSKASQDVHPEYKLSGTIVHSGYSPDSGHYYAYIKDAMGRWYCCNDSYVSLSTLQEVVSEKVYILFYTRSKQRPPIVKAGPLVNGSKCCQSNGSNASKDVKLGQSEKPMNGKHLPGHDSALGNSITSKLDKVPCGPPSRKLGIFENSDIRKPHGNGGIKIIIDNKEPVEKTCKPASSSEAEGNQKNAQRLTDTNGIGKARQADAANSVKSNYYAIANGKDKIQHVGADSLETVLYEDDPRKKNMSSGRTPEHKRLSNGDVKCSSHNSELKTKSQDKDASILLAKDATRGITPNDEELSNGVVKFHSGSAGMNGKSQVQVPYILANDETRGINLEHKETTNGDIKCGSDSSGLKRKPQDRDSSAFLAKDAQSRTEVEAFKKVIEKEASLVLRSCGWSDEVYNFMRSRKRLCIGEAKYDASNVNEMKRLLMADAKSAFLSKVPETLKGNLIERLVLFSQQKQSPGT